MSEQSMKKLKKRDLLELLIQATKENNELQAALEEKTAALEEKDALLADRKLAASELGTMSGACLKLNGVFEAADAAAQQYLENVQNASARAEEACAGLLEEAKAKAEQIVKEAEEKAAEINAAAEANRLSSEKEAEAYWATANERLEKFYAEHKGLRELLMFDT